MKYITAVNCMYALLAVGSVWVMLSLFKRSRSPDSKIHLDDLLLGDDGRISNSKVVMMGSFVFTTWMMTYLIATDKMTEGYLGLFLASWVAPALTNRIAQRGYSPYNQRTRYPIPEDEEPPLRNRFEDYR